MDFFLLDNSEDISQDPTVFYLFGKTPGEVHGEYISCCLRITGVKKYLYVRLRDDGQDTVEKVKEKIHSVAKIQRYNSLKTELVYRRLLEKDCREEEDFGNVHPFIEISYSVQRNKQELQIGKYAFPECNVVSVHDTEWSPIERFLICKEIKGPCWLKIEDAVPSQINTYSSKTYDSNEEKITVRDQGDTGLKDFPEITIASLHMTFRTLSEENRKETGMEYCLQSFSCIIHRKAPLMPFNAKQFYSNESQDLKFYHFTILQKDDSDDSFPVNEKKWELTYPNSFKKKEEVFDVRCFKESEQQDFYNKIVQVILDEDPDMVINHGMVRRNFIRFIYELQIRAKDVVFRTFMGRLKQRNFSLGLKDIDNPKYKKLMLKGRIIMDTHILFQNYMKDDISKMVRTDNLQELIEAYGLQDMVEPEQYRDVKCVLGGKKENLFDDPEKSGCLQFMEPMTQETSDDGFIKSHKQSDYPPYYYREADENKPFGMGYIINHMNACFQQLALLYRLQLIPFTLQLTKMCGNMWSQNLTNYTANRIEYQILHAMHSKGYIIEKRGVNQMGDTEETYTGGKTIDNIDTIKVSGCYDRYSFLVDVSSMYPSIIEKKNICISDPNQCYHGVDKKKKNVLILPWITDHVRRQRSEIRKKMEGMQRDSTERMVYEIKESVLKLINNQCYGYLGYNYARFRNKKLASEITKEGRVILGQLVKVVKDKQQELGFRVIYGVTDSLLIYKNDADFIRCRKQFDVLYREMNTIDPHITLKLDGIYRKVILYSKNQYTALRIRNPDTYEFSIRKFTRILEPPIRNLYDIYQIQIVGCEIVKRPLPYFAQRICMYILHQVLLWDAHVFRYIKKESKDELERVFRQDIERFLNITADTLGKVKSFTPSGCTERLLRLIQITTKMGKAYSSYKKNASKGEHVRLIDRVGYHKERYSYYEAKLPYIYTHCNGIIGPNAILCNEIVKTKPCRIHWDVYFDKYLYGLINKTCSPFQELVSGLQRICSVLGLEAKKFSLQNSQPEQVGEKRKTSSNKLVHYSLQHQIENHYFDIVSFGKTQQENQLGHLFGPNRHMGIVDMHQPVEDVPFSHFDTAKKIAFSAFTKKKPLAIECGNCKNTLSPYCPLKNLGEDGDEQQTGQFGETPFVITHWNTKCPSCKKKFDIDDMEKSITKCVTELRHEKENENETIELNLNYWKWLMDVDTDLVSKGCSPEEELNLLSDQKSVQFFTTVKNILERHNP